MRNTKYYIFLFALTLIFSASATAAAQAPFQETDNVAARPNLLQELNLSPNQVREIRRLNRELRPILQESQRRFREANRALDRAVYSDNENDAEIQSRIRDLHAAHAEFIRNRTTTELAIRRILTPEQLGKFRILNAQSMRNNDGQRMPNRQNKLRSLPGNLRERRQQNRRLRAKPE